MKNKYSYGMGRAFVIVLFLLISIPRELFQLMNKLNSNDIVAYLNYICILSFEVQILHDYEMYHLK